MGREYFSYEFPHICDWCSSNRRRSFALLRARVREFAFGCKTDAKNSCLYNMQRLVSRVSLRTRVIRRERKRGLGEAKYRRKMWTIFPYLRLVSSMVIQSRVSERSGRGEDYLNTPYSHEILDSRILVEGRATFG